MSNYPQYRYLRVTIGLAALMLFLILFFMSLPQESYAKTTDPVSIQQTGAMHPMTPTMPIGQGHMGRMMQMMGMMMQMMGHMQEMQEGSTGMMHGAMSASGTMSPTMHPMMGMMNHNKPLTNTRPLHDPRSMNPADPMPMMSRMMGMMEHMQRMMGAHRGMMHGTGPMSGTVAMGHGSMMMGSGMPMTDTMPLHQMEMMGNMLQMMGQMMQTMGHRQGMLDCLPAATAPALKADGNLAQTAQIGAITLAVEPLNLHNTAAQTLDFKVTLDTHSGELNFDLRKLVTLRVGDKEIQATAWQPASASGQSAHHVSGTLRFPTTDAAGKLLLTAETPVVLIIRNLGGSNEQSFAWK